MNKKILKYYKLFSLAMLLIIGLTTNVSAAEDPLRAVNNLSNFMFQLIRAIGFIIVGFGVVQIGMSFKSQDPSQRANGFLSFLGGIIIVCAKPILDVILK